MPEVLDLKFSSSGQETAYRCSSYNTVKVTGEVLNGFEPLTSAGTATKVVGFGMSCSVVLFGDFLSDHYSGMHASFYEIFHYIKIVVKRLICS